MGGRTELAEDLVENILVRLPVKSLMRFKCVDRSWNVLFKTPTFVNNHLQIHRNQDNIMFSHRYFFRWVDLNKFLMLDSRDMFPEFNSEGLYDDDKIHLYNTQGHCNGVFCICVLFKHEIFPGEGRYHKSILWNPATREVKVVPPPPMPSRSHHYTLLSGFGADPNSNDLNVVNLIIDNENNHPPHAVLYNLITNSWTLITIDPVLVDTISNLSLNYRGFLAKGICYWIISHGCFDDENILCFDFRNNQFHILQRPPTSKGNQSDFITEVNDSTAYVVHYYGKENYCKVEIWILEQDRWTKKHTFPPFEALDGLYNIWKGGAEFIGLAAAGGQFHSFNSDSQLVRSLGVSSLMTDVVLKYVESITSLSF
ncbi:hypothetical protein TanjilG_00426 [Lupinus angustifolius]|uniref:F-box associated beta-propeller type 1 domain-containing protein n=2 Tax=Lupinus angustifolius TaxID=3871 RepID=A0A1J7HCE5_LUPAN|nr:hypothetical protein TanjilG_00426 [Lupinus angustifolius]